MNIKIIRIRTFFEFGRGRHIIDPLVPLYHRLYWYLIAFGVLFWVGLMLFNFRFG